MPARAKYGALVLTLPLLVISAGSVSAQSRVQVVPNEAAPQRGRHGRREAVHVLHLADDVEEAGALPDTDRQRHARYPRLPARAAERASAWIIRTTSACGSTTAT